MPPWSDFKQGAMVRILKHWNSTFVGQVGRVVDVSTMTSKPKIVVKTDFDIMATCDWQDLELVEAAPSLPGHILDAIYIAPAQSPAPAQSESGSE